MTSLGTDSPTPADALLSPQDSLPSDRRKPDGRGSAAGVVVAAGLYLLIVCVLYWPVAPWSDTLIINRARGDPLQTIWFLEWVPWAIVHGHNPLFSTYIDVPHGANLTANTATPLLGVLGSPISFTLGPAATLNVLLRVGWAGSGLAMFVLLRRWTSWWPAAFLGGLLFVLNPFMLQQSATHLDLLFMVVPPLLLLALDELVVRRSRRPVVAGVAVGLLAAAQWFIDSEIFVDCVVVALLGLALLAMAHWRQVKATLVSVVPGLVAGSLVCGAVIAYPFWLFVAGPEHLVGPVSPAWEIAGYRGDLLGPVLPSLRHVTRPPALVVASYHHVAPVPWQGNELYLGIPLLVLLITVTVVWWRDGVMRFAAAMVLLTFLLSLGGSLELAGHTTDVPLPERLLSDVPALSNVVPQRFSVFTWLFLAVLLGVGLDRSWAAAMASLQRRRASIGLGPTSRGAHARSGHRVRFPSHGSAMPAIVSTTMVAVVVLCLVPIMINGRHRVSASAPQPRAAGFLAANTPRAGVVLFLPPVANVADTPMLWQAQGHMAFKMVGGYAIVPGNAYESFLSPTPSTALAAQWAASPNVFDLDFTVPVDQRAYEACLALPEVLRQYGVDTLALWSAGSWNEHAIDQAAVTVLGPPTVEQGRLMLWTRARSRVDNSASCTPLRDADMTSLSASK